MLSALIWIPVLAAAVIGFWPGTIAPNLVRRITLIIMVIVLALSVVITTQFDPNISGWQLTEFWPWLPSLGLNYSLGIDGLSLPLLLLNSVLGFTAIYSTNESLPRPRLYYSLMLIIVGGVAGAFVAQNLLLFFIFFEVELIPLYLLIAIWGGEKRGYAATKFLLYTAFSGVLVLGAFLGTVWISDSPSFDWQDLNISALSLKMQVILLSVLLVGFGIKIPIVPFHTWLPDAHVEASTPVSILLAGVLLKLGTYGLVRFGLEMFHEAWPIVAPWLASVSVLSVLYGASCAIAQKDMKKIVAYSSIAHMGYILLASSAATAISLLGLELQMVSHGLISGLLFLSVGIVYRKTGTRDVNILKGLLTPERGLPIIGSLMILGVMASAGIPGMAGFIAEFLIFRGSLTAFPLQTILCMIGTGLTSVYFLIMINRVFFGRLSDVAVNLPQSTWIERAPGVVLAVIIVILGVQPQIIVNLSESAMKAAAIPAQNVAILTKSLSL